MRRSIKGRAVDSLESFQLIKCWTPRHFAPSLSKLAFTVPSNFSMIQEPTQNMKSRSKIVGLWGYSGVSGVQGGVS